MSTNSLPERPSLENLKKQAKALVKAAHAGDGAVHARIGPYFGDQASIGLQQAQLVLAREFGFSSWLRLKRHIEAGAPEGETGDQRANRFLDLVTVAYGAVPDFGPARFEQARALLDAHPEIARENIYVAAAIGDGELVADWLDRDASLLDAKGGFFQWPPIMYAAYARLPGRSSFPAAEVLLARGADPDAFYMWGGTYRFTALTGVFGQGEGGPVNQPEHPEVEAFARALLSAGANPNDGQALYNRCFEPGDLCPRLLVEYGLSPEAHNNWLVERDGKRVENPDKVLHFHLILSIRDGYVGRAKLLIDAGADLDRPDDSYETRVKGRSPYEAALLMGQVEIADYLAAKGARVTSLDGIDAWEAAALAGDETTARALLADRPDLAQEAEQRQYVLMLEATHTRNHAALRAMVAMGFPISRPATRTPLHVAAYHGDIETARVLLDLGADPTIRDGAHFSAPIGHAMYANRYDMIALLEQVPMDIFTAAARGLTDRLAAMIEADPAAVNVRFADIRPETEVEVGHDWMTPLVFAAMNGRREAAALLVKHGADPAVAGPDGTTAAALARGQGHDAIADDLEAGAG